MRPSDLVGVSDEYEAFCFDSAVAEWGNWISAELDKVSGKTEKQVRARKEAKLRGLFMERKAGARKFADPAVLMKNE